MTKKKEYKGRKRGRKSFGGFYCTTSLRLPSEADYNLIADLPPSERGEAMLRGISSMRADAEKIANP